MEYPDSVRFLHALGNELKTAKFGLERMDRLMREINDPHRRPGRFVHVAGTNGKGSTCAMIESGLRRAGIRTGLFTSPHLLEPTERIRIDGEPVSASDFSRAFDRVHEAAEALIETGEIDLHPSYFETVTAMGFLVFREKQVDIAVIEVGLGGRLDATNVVEPELCVITPVDFDHEQFLGTTIESIAFEKAGILKRGVPVVIAPQSAEARAVILQRARELQVRMIDSEPVWIEGLPLLGRHQMVNAATAATALTELGIAPGIISEGLRNTRWPGRLERLRHDPETIVDGAHNPSGARALAAYVGEHYRDPKPVLIFGVMRDKAVEEMAGILFPLFRKVIVTAPDQPRALAPETFLNLIDHPDLQVAANLKSALEQGLATGGPIFISGSLFLVAEAMRLLQ